MDKVYNFRREVQCPNYRCKMYETDAMAFQNIEFL